MTLFEKAKPLPKPPLTEKQKLRLEVLKVMRDLDISYDEALKIVKS